MNTFFAVVVFVFVFSVLAFVAYGRRATPQTPDHGCVQPR
jgi:hypothetical protein